MTQDEAKLAVAKRAVEFVEDGMRVGLGTGTTATIFIRELAKCVEAGLRIRCVASSDASHKLGLSLGMDVTTLDELPELDIYIDGADEVGPGLALIKGGGGALLREKIVASAAPRFIVVVDESKIVNRLGEFPLPVEVIKMALPLVLPKLAALGAANSWSITSLLIRRSDGIPRACRTRRRPAARSTASSISSWRSSPSARSHGKPSMMLRGGAVVSPDGEPPAPTRIWEGP